MRIYKGGEVVGPDDLIDLLDGEAEILNDKGDFCFDHAIFLNDICVECGYPIK